MIPTPDTPARCIRLICLVLCGLLILAGTTANRAQDTPRIGLNYGPFRQGQTPDGAAPSMAELEEDIVAMAEKVAVIRLYSTSGLGEQIIALAQQHNLEVIAQAWIDRDLESNQREIQAVIDAANTYDNVVAVLVGSEVLLRGESLSVYHATTLASAPCFPGVNLADDPLVTIPNDTEIRVFGKDQRRAIWLVEHENHICWVEGKSLAVDPDFPATTVTYFNQ